MATVSRVLGACRTLVTKAATATTPAAAGTGTGRGSGILKPLPISQPLANFSGEKELSRSGAVKKVWEYIKLNSLQNPANKKEIYCDDKLKTIFNGKETVGFTEIGKLLSSHFPKSAK